MRICIVVAYDLAEEGGVKRHAVRLAESLRRGGDEVWIAGPSSGGDHGPFVKGFGGVVNLPGNGSDNRFGILTPPWQVWRFFHEHKFDVVHLHEPYAPSLPYYALWSSLTSAHVCTFHSFNEHEGPVSRAARRFFGSLVSSRYERGIAVSEPAERFARHAWTRPLAIIPNGVCTTTFSPPRATVEDEQRPLRLLFVGHWRDERKGLGYLLDAFAQLQRGGLAVELDVIGDGGARRAPLVEGVRFHGAISAEASLVPRYQACDLFVAPTTGQESFGIVLLEAMATARPIVCSDIDGYRQVVREDGARFVRPLDATALADTIAALAADPVARRRMGMANRRRAEEFDWDRLAPQVRAEYVAALAARGTLPVGVSAPVASPTVGDRLRVAK